MHTESMKATADGWAQLMIAGVALLVLLLWASVQPLMAQERMLPRQIDHTTTLVRDGQSEAIIVYPAGPEGLRLAEEVQQSIRSVTGVTVRTAVDGEVVTAVPEWPAERYRNVPLILIGNIHTNQAIVPLYANLLAGADAYYPGGDGYTLRTVVNPYGTWVNEVVLGGSSPEGFGRTVEAFGELVRRHGRQGELVLPGLLEVVPEGKAAKAVEAAVEASPTSYRHRNLLNYQWTGRPEVLDKALTRLRNEDFMKPGTAFYNPHHYGKEQIVRELISMIQAGVLDVDEVNHIENVLLAGLHDEDGEYYIVEDGEWLGTRHQTMAMMASLVTADYLLNRAKPNEQAAAYLRQRVEQAHAYFKQFERSYRDEGNDNTSFDSTGPVSRYFMAYGNARFFESGMAARMAQRTVMMTDNRGFFVAPGNYEDSRQGRMMRPLDPNYSIGVPAFVYDDGRLNWLTRNTEAIAPMSGESWRYMPGIAGGRYPLHDGVPLRRPDEWIGATVLKLTPHHYDLAGTYMTHGLDPKIPQPWADLVPRDRALDMLCLRDGFQPEDQYLFISGFQGGRYNSMDANSIVRFSDLGHIWLISQTEQFGHYFRNALHIGRRHDGNYLSTPGTLRLDALANRDHLSMTATTLPAFNGADWTRHIFSWHGEYFVVIDTATFNEDGDFDLTCTWRSLPVAQLDDDGVWRARYMDARFELHNADGIEQSAGYERGRPTEQMGVVPYVLRQHRAVQVSRGEHVSVKNMFFVTDRDDDGYQLRAAGADAVMVMSDEHHALVGVNLEGRAEVGTLSTDARLFFVSTQAIELFPDTATLWLNGQPVATRTSDPAVARALRELWTTLPAESSPEQSEPAVAQVAPGMRPAWSFNGYRQLHQEIGGVSVVSPKSVQNADLLFDRQIEIHTLPHQWPSSAETVTYDLGRVQEIAQIQLDTLLDIENRRGDGRPEFWLKERAGTIELAFSNDNFQSDTRGMTVPYDVVYRHDPPAAYKPLLFTPKHWKQVPSRSARPLQVKARYVRTPAAPTFDTVFFSPRLRPADIDDLCPVDLDGDGQDELAVATEGRELVVLNANGRVRWRMTLDNVATELFAMDADGDGAQMLLVADNGWYLRGFSSSGEVVYSVDCSKEDIRGVYAMGATKPVGADQPFLVVATGQGAVALDPQGHLYCHTLYGLACSDVVLRGTSTDELASSRTATRNPWQVGGWKQLKWFPPDQRQEPIETRTPGGSLDGLWWLGLGLEFWPEQGGPESWRDGLAVLVARAGICAYDLGEPQPTRPHLWAVTANGPISGYAWADMDGEPGVELIVSRQDGFVDVVNRSGDVIRSWPVGQAVHDVCAWSKGGSAIAVATGDAVAFYDTEGTETGRIAVPAEKLTVLRTHEQTVLVAAGEGATTALQYAP